MIEESNFWMKRTHGEGEIERNREISLTIRSAKSFGSRKRDVKSGRLKSGCKEDHPAKQLTSQMSIFGLMET